MKLPGSGPSASAKAAGIGEYVKRAFLFRWNLLAFGGGIAASLLSPWPDAALLLVAASELVYLTGLISIPKFRDAVDAQTHQQNRKAEASTGQRTFQELVSRLSHQSQLRFDMLRSRCLEMRSIAEGVRGRSEAGQDVSELSTGALDRLLWVFLRLLVSQEALVQFLTRTDVKQIRARLDDAKAKLESSKDDERIARSLADSVAVQQMRLDNWDKARRNAEFVRIEIDRIEAKIQAVIEASVNRQDPNFMSSQID